MFTKVHYPNQEMFTPIDSFFLKDPLHTLPPQMAMCLLSSLFPSPCQIYQLHFFRWNEPEEENVEKPQSRKYTRLVGRQELFLIHFISQDLHSAVLSPDVIQLSENLNVKSVKDNC